MQRVVLPYLAGLLTLVFQLNAQDSAQIRWGAPMIINDIPVVEPGRSTEIRHGNYGSEYVRLLHLRNGDWLAGTVSVNEGYKKNQSYGPASTGGLELQISKSIDQGKHWESISAISDPGRDLDNTQLIETKNGSVLLACRSVRWQESYILRIYKSNNKGLTWSKFSVIDSTAGSPGTLGHPDKGDIASSVARDEGGHEVALRTGRIQSLPKSDERVL